MSTEPVTARQAESGGWPEMSRDVITGEIARGGRVLAGRELVLDRKVAIKILLPHAAAERFVTESKITAWLPHPSIPPSIPWANLRMATGPLGGWLRPSHWMRQSCDGRRSG